MLATGGDGASRVQVCAHASNLWCDGLTNYQAVLGDVLQQFDEASRLGLRGGKVHRGRRRRAPLACLVARRAVESAASVVVGTVGGVSGRLSVAGASNAEVQGLFLRRSLRLACTSVYIDRQSTK